MQEGIEIIDKCVECGRAWDKDGQVQIICEQCKQRNEVYWEEGEDPEEIEKAKNGGVIDLSNYVCDL